MSVTTKTAPRPTSTTPTRRQPAQVPPLESSDPAPGRTSIGPAGQGLVTLVWAFLAVSILAKAWISFGVTHFVLVDDAYIHLRYAQNFVHLGELVYNPGEAVFGLTSPLYSIVATGITALSGPFVEQAVTFLNLALWSATGWMIARRLSIHARLATLAVFLFWPSFVDNQLLGMETALFVFLLVAALHAAVDGRTARSAVAYGLALITRPEAILLVPSLLYACAAAHGARGVFAKLARPRVLAALFGPGILWCAFALQRYGSVIPQSMIAKNGWSSEHYDSIFTLESVFRSFPRLTFLPFTDYFPMALQTAATGGILALVLAVGIVNLKHGSSASRAWFLFYALYMAFYLIGKGATEASWYSIPSSVALLLAAEPLWPRVGERARHAIALAGGVALLGGSVFMAFRRAPLLQSYVDGYGRSAEAVNGMEEQRSRVLIGEIGVYGFKSEHDIVDVAALVSPEVLPMKNAGYSLLQMVQESQAKYFVVSQGSLDENSYPSVGPIWADAEERAWFEGHCSLVAEYLDKRTFRVD